MHRKRNNLVSRFLNNTMLKDCTGHTYSLKNLLWQLTHCPFYQHSSPFCKFREVRFFFSHYFNVFGNLILVTCWGNESCIWPPEGAAGVREFHRNRMNYQDILKGGWVQRDVFCDSYHSWPACGVLDLMIATSSIGGKLPVSALVSHWKKDLLKWLLVSFVRAECLPSRKKYFMLSTNSK